MLSRVRLFPFVTKHFVNQTRGVSKKSPQGYELEVSNKNADEIVEFLDHTFIQDEPIIQAMGIQDTCDLQRYLKKHHVAGGHVIKVTDDACDLQALAMCTVCSPETSNDTRTFADCSVCDHKTKRLLHLWADIADSNDLFNCFKVDQIWDISILATAPSARGKGLAKLLTVEAKRLGKKEGLSITRLDCTSFFSAKLAASLNFVTLPPRNVMTFRDKKGCPWLCKEPPHPHGHVIVAYDFLV